jgi:hypothetical protein
MRAVAAALAVLTAIAAGGCGVEGSDMATTPMRCVQPPGQLSGTQVLIAQAVRGASLIPCVRDEVDHWIVTDLDVDTGHARVVLEYRPGDADVVTIELASRCDLAGAHEVSSEHPGVRRYDRDVKSTDQYRGQHYYTYPDACTSLQYSLTGRYPALRGAEIPSIFGFVSRDDLDERIGEVSDRGLHLDPSTGR